MEMCKGGLANKATSKSSSRMLIFLHHDPKQGIVLTCVEVAAAARAPNIEGMKVFGLTNPPILGGGKKHAT